MKRWKLIAGIILVFVLGVLSGTLGTGFYVKQKMKPIRHDSKARRTVIIEKLTRGLDLKESQIPKIEKILDEIDQKRREYRQEIRKMRTESISQMKKELTPEQQIKLDELHRQWELRREKRRSSKS